MRSSDAPALIGLCGRAGAGKTTAAYELLKAVNMAGLSFAWPIKAMIRTLLREAGVDDIERRLTGDLKEAPCAALAMQSPRHAMQTLGTEWGRQCINPALWVSVGMSTAEKLRGQGIPVAFDDVRFTNEAEAIRAAGGVVVEITGRATEGVPAHTSEVMDFRPDLTIANTGSPSDLRAALLAKIGI